MKSLKNINEIKIELYKKQIEIPGKKKKKHNLIIDQAQILNKKMKQLV